MTDVIETLIRLGNPLTKAQVATTLNRFSDMGRIRIVQERRGNKGAIYEKVPSK